MYQIENADEYACQITNKAGYDIAEVVRHGRRVEGDDAAGWATSRGLPLEHHTTDAQWRRLLLLLNAAPAMLAALKECREWIEMMTSPDVSATLEIAKKAIAMAEEGIDA